MKRKFRADIQFLRSLAIGFVLLNHLMSWRFPGGFIGVDIFFVISGYLIIGHITDAIRSHSFSFKNFYIKRAWRLLPAAWVTLLVTFLITQYLVPSYQSGDLNPDFLSSWFYVQNIHLMHADTNYFSGVKSFAIYEHFWSLAVEEQFYIFTPLILYLVYNYAKKSRKSFSSYNIFITILMSASILSFSFALYKMNFAYADANYFNTFSRIWEFTIGGLIYIAPQFNSWQRTNKLVIYSCYGVLLISLFFLNPGFIFPGPATLIPVITTALIIYFGSSNPNRAFENLKPFQYVGNISYPLYLWHLPVFLLLPYANIPLISKLNPEAGLTYLGLCCALLISFALAHVTHYYVEKPLQLQRKKLQIPRKTLSSLTASSFVIVGLFFVQPTIATALEQHELKKYNASVQTCLSGSPVKNMEQKCSQTIFNEAVSPSSPATIQKPFTDAGCTLEATEHYISGECKFGKAGKHDIFITGDSHVAQWSPAIVKLAQEQHLNINVFAMYSCPFINLDGLNTTFNDLAKKEYYNNTQMCSDYDKVAMDFIRDKKPMHTIVSNFSSNEILSYDKNPTYGKTSEGLIKHDQKSDAILAAKVPQRAQEILQNSQTLTYIKDQARDVNTISSRCLDYKAKDPRQCQTTGTPAMFNDPQYNITRTLTMPGISSLNFDQYLCGTKCYGAINGQRTYFDSNHLNTDFVKTFQQPIIDQLKQAMNVNTQKAESA
ncbi:MAG: acyltransferase family protein [Micrococcaceae bacterium]